LFAVFFQNSSSTSLTDVYGGQGGTPPLQLPPPTYESLPSKGAARRSSSGNQVSRCLSRMPTPCRVRSFFPALTQM
jgi:hypothetical protein